MAAFMTTAEVAARWGCSARHVRDLCASGELRAMRLGIDAWRIAVADVEAYEQRHTTQARSNATPKQEVPTAAAQVAGAASIEGLVLPSRWWEQETSGAASSAAVRGRSPKTKKAALSGN
jgi:excisionase family DNA binding protein